jgi:hypothetical protein
MLYDMDNVSEFLFPRNIKSLPNLKKTLQNRITFSSSAD